MYEKGELVDGTVGKLGDGEAGAEAATGVEDSSGEGTEGVGAGGALDGGVSTDGEGIEVPAGAAGGGCRGASSGMLAEA